MFGKVPNMLLFELVSKVTDVSFINQLNTKGNRQPTMKNQTERASQTSKWLKEDLVKQRKFINF